MSASTARWSQRLARGPRTAGRTRKTVSGVRRPPGSPSGAPRIAGTGARQRGGARIASEIDDDISRISKDTGPTTVGAHKPSRSRVLKDRAAVEEVYRAHQDLAKNQDRLFDLMKGIDWSDPVSERTLVPGDVIEQWVRKGRRDPGRHFTAVGEDPAKLGIELGDDGLPDGRELRRYVVTEEMTVVESTTATLKSSASFKGGPGGGTQLFAEPGWVSKLKEIPAGGAR